ncbi:hypothetical protein [Arthrobacter sp. NEB 688]|uniref:hypothetical protein n=1 Tax=Arthrobacter sp. NEB 688 TaxID=904039 RepID=UPI001566CF66|nr:hypothetical protein [Arthrobacter sp. NEB 688]QKE82868.1 hypothetical protein HL663_02150 [Arthrobacter sp. NEB 688]
MTADTSSAPSLPTRRAAATAGGPGSMLATAADLVAAGLEQTLAAARSGDATAARRVVRGSGRRRLACRRADCCARVRVAHRVAAPHALPRTASELRLVAELDHLGGLVDSLARQVATGALPPTALAALRDDLDTLASCGVARLRRLSTLSGPDMDPGYRHDGEALRAVLDHLPALAEAPSPRTPQPALTCRRIVESVLAASSLAARIA